MKLDELSNSVPSLHRSVSTDTSIIVTVYVLSSSLLR